MKPEWLLGEVADEIDKLNGRPDSTGRCLLALDQYLQSRSEEDRAVLRAASEAIPEHLRRYALGDMDAKAWPLRVLCAGTRGQIHIYYERYHEPVTEDPGPQVLRNEYPAAIVVDSVSYPTVVHAYWALAAADPAAAEQIRTADRPYDAERLAEQAPGCHRSG